MFRNHYYIYLHVYPNLYALTPSQKVESVSGNLSIGHKNFCKNIKVRCEKCVFFVWKCILGLLNVQKITYFLRILILFLLRYLRIVWSYESVEEWSKNFLPESDSLKYFWRLGCQVANLFAPSPSLSSIPGNCLCFQGMGLELAILGEREKERLVSSRPGWFLIFQFNRFFFQLNFFQKFTNQ